MTTRWFKDAAGMGERALAGQILGLDPLWPVAASSTVLDLGCAEGTIGLHFAQRGATLVHGVEILPDRVRDARSAFAGLRTEHECWQADLAQIEQVEGALRDAYDIVLALAIVHKLAEPLRFLDWAASRAREWLAIRLPTRRLHDRRSPHIDCDIAEYLADRFALAAEAPAHLNEWTGIFRRHGSALP